MAEIVLEREAPTQTAPRPAPSAEAEAIAQRLAQFRATMELIDSIPDHRAAAGLGPLPDNIREIAYEEREAALL